MTAVLIAFLATTKAGPDQVVIGAGRDHLAARPDGEIGADDVVAEGDVEPQLAERDADPVRDHRLVLAGEVMGGARLGIAGTERRERGQEIVERSSVAPPA